MVTAVYNMYTVYSFAYIEYQDELPLLSKGAV